MDDEERHAFFGELRGLPLRHDVQGVEVREELPGEQDGRLEQPPEAYELRKHALEEERKVGVSGLLDHRSDARSRGRTQGRCATLDQPWSTMFHA